MPRHPKKPTGRQRTRRFTTWTELESRLTPTTLSTAIWDTTLPPPDTGLVPAVDLRSFRPAAIDPAAVVQQLAATPSEAEYRSGVAGTVFTLPAPDGTNQRFEVIDVPVMAPELAALFPDIHTFQGQGIDDPTATLRMDVTPLGFHAMVLSSAGSWMIDPYYNLRTDVYASYYRDDYVHPEGHSAGCMCGLCAAASVGAGVAGLGAAGGGGAAGAAGPTAGISSGTQLRTYRLAVAATGEFTATLGGSAAAGQAAIVTLVNRVNAVYESELSVRLVLVAGNQNLVYTNASSDPYTNSSHNAMIDENRANLDSVIGAGNYDVGQVFSTSGGGLAYVRAVGNTLKGGGSSGSDTGSPLTDAYFFNVICHEMGHQFGATHTFNTSSDLANRSAATAYEPGSGSTIMSYAGAGSIALPDILQFTADPMFNASAFEQIISYVDTTIPGVGTRTATGNTAPVVTVPPTVYVIPAKTPFVLTAAGTDANGDALTYSWEERDLGPATLLSTSDNGASPLFRVQLPTTDPSRTFPKLTDLVNNVNTNPLGERLPETNRAAMKFRVTARDNRTGGGGVNTADATVQVVDTGAAFTVTAPNTGLTWFQGFPRTVTWTVAGTATGAINAQKVNITLSTDGGLTYPITLASNVDNDGSETITVPTVSTTRARVRVQPTNNIFFDISNANFTITVDPTALIITSNGGGPTAAVGVFENATAVTTVTTTGAGGPVTYSISGGADQARFTINPTTGVLTFSPAPNFEVPADADGDNQYVVTVRATDGVKVGTQTLTVTVGDVNEVPTFTVGANPTILEDAGAQSVAGFLTNVRTGPDPEAGQTLSFTVTVTGTTGTMAFTAAPAIDATGRLTYTVAPNANGTATISVVAKDSGGTANGGVDTSAAQTFVITATAVNDAPSFVVGPNQTVLENSPAQSVTGFAAAISAGPADEAGQALSFTVTVTGTTGTLAFTVAPAIAANGLLTYTVAPGTVGLATISVVLNDNGGTANGGVSASAAQTFTIRSATVNDPPTFTVGPNPTVLEDAGAQAVPGFLTAISAGPPDEAYQTVFIETAVVGTTGTMAFTVAPSIDATGRLTYTVAPNANGTATISVVAKDDGGTAGGGVDKSAAQTFVISATAVNDPPTFTGGPNQTVLEDAAPQSVANFVTGVSAGPPDEAGQAVAFTVTVIQTTGTLAFTAAPAIDATGRLTYTLAPNTNGTATISVVAKDDGGTANGGADTSSAQTFVITATAVNDPPAFTVGLNQTVLEDAAPQSVANFVTGISTGPPDESSQTVSFVVTAATPSLFSTQPAIDATGRLTYTLAPNANGTVTITVVAKDTGGGADTSAAQTFTITITPVNDAPSFGVGANQNVRGDAGPQTVPGFASSILAGPPDEAGQNITFTVSVDKPALFAVLPTVDAAGTLRYTPSRTANGVAQITVTATDNGGTANGGVNTSAPATFTVSITSFAEPVITPVTTAEDTLSAAGGLVLSTGLVGSPVTHFQITAIRGGKLFRADGVTPVADGDFLPVAVGQAGLRFLPDADANDASAPGGFGFRVRNSTSATAAGLELTGTTAVVSVTPVNDPPSFVLTPAATVPEDAGAQLIAGFASAISAGPADEAGQPLTFAVTIVGTTGGLTFSQAPAIDPATGALTFQTAPDSNGSADIEVTIDDGNGGRVTLPATISVTPVNDTPDAAVLVPAVVTNRAGPRTVANAFAFGTGAANETDPLAATVRVVGTTGRFSFTTFPSVAADGTLTYAAAPGTAGTATLAVTLSDGSATAPEQFITLDVGRRTGLVGVPDFAAGAGDGRSDVTLYAEDQSPRFSVFTEAPGAGTGIRTAVGDFNRDGVGDLVTVTGPGGTGVLTVRDGATGRLLATFNPYELSFTGGLYVAVGDVNGDGTPDVVVTPDEGGGPRVDVYSGAGFGKLAGFMGIDDPNFRGGGRVAVGDVNGDGFSDVVVAAGAGGGPRVAVFDGRSLGGFDSPRRMVNDFFAFEPSLRDGVFVAVGDVDGDGMADVIVGGGPGGAPRVSAFDGRDLVTSGGAKITRSLDFFAGNTDDRGGVRVAVKDFDDDAQADLLIGAGSGSGSAVTGYLGRTLTSGALVPLFQFDAFDGFAGGVFVG